jgi:hypothetical protein
MNNTNNMNISNEHLLLINILNTMYNDNNRQIQNLTDQNNQIISIITDILHVPSFNNRQNNQSSNRRQNNREQGNRQNNRNNNFGSVFLNNRQYIIDDIQRLNSHSTFPSVAGTGIEGRLCGNYIDAAARDAARGVTRDAGRIQSERPANIFSNLFQSFFDPVVIYPTASQIETATRRVLYRDIVTPINSSCPISMENFNDNETVTIIRHCGHIFNIDELATWFQSNCRCPVCRYDIRNFNGNISSLSNQERNNTTNDLIHDISGNILSPQYSEDISGNPIQW